VPAPDEVVDFVERMPNGQMLSANVGINTKLSLSSLLGMHRIMSSGVHFTIEFAPTELFQDPSANYELQPQPGEEEELETEDQSRMRHELLQRRWPVAAIPRGACDSVFIMPKAKSLSMIASVLLKRFAILPNVSFRTPAAFLHTLSPFDSPPFCFERCSSLAGSTRRITLAGRRTANVSVAK
jgi:hypothetical protein